MSQDLVKPEEEKSETGGMGLSVRSIGIAKGGAKGLAVEPNDDDEMMDLAPEGKVKILSAAPHMVIRAKEKSITIGKKEYSVDPYDLIYMIRRTTQMIGQYNDNEDEVFAAYMVANLRKMRTDMASALESHFGVHFQVTETGKSVFWIG